MAQANGDRKFRVVVIGAGISGLYMAETLIRAGIDFVVYEKAGEVGGTWRENTYPGLFVDVLSRQYEFLFDPNYDWSRKYAPADEIQAYIVKTAKKRGWYKHIKFNTEIVDARFVDGAWHLKTDKGDTDVADVFIAATGFLHKPVMPNIPGMETFAGPSFHSARFDHSVPYKGKRWGVIGSGCSGIQITEALAWKDCEVTQFIRRAQWIHIRENPRTSLWERIRLRLPGMYKKKQAELWDFIIKGDAWRLRPGPQRDAMQAEFRAYLDHVRDPELKKKLTPDFHLGCTRIPKSDQNYYEAVQRPNVKVVKGSIARIHPDGIEMADGARHKLDVIVYATGFDTHAYMRPMTVTGLNGVTIDQVWKDDIYSFAGVGLPGFPNMFLLYGPFAPLNNIPVPVGLEQEIGYIMQAIELSRSRHVAVAPTEEATQKFVKRMHDSIPGTVWVGCHNWYIDTKGTPILWPLPQDEHGKLLAQLDESDLEMVEGRPSTPASS